MVTKQTLVVYQNTEKTRTEEGKKGYPKQMQNLSKKGSSPQKRDKQNYIDALAQEAGSSREK